MARISVISSSSPQTFSRHLLTTELSLQLEFLTQVNLSNFKNTEHVSNH